MPSNYITQECTGCCELGENGQGAENYPWDEKAQCYVGMGCHECGYTGKRRLYFNPKDFDDEAAQPEKGDQHAGK